MGGGRGKRRGRWRMEEKMERELKFAVSARVVAKSPIKNGWGDRGLTKKSCVNQIQIRLSL